MSAMSNQGQCEHCAASFAYELWHAGFSDMAYAYCEKCGRTATFDLLRAPPGSKTGCHQAIPEEAEAELEPCECGGYFRRNASPRCPQCHQPLDAEKAAKWIEANAPGTAGGWRWQRSWVGLYVICIEQRLAKDVWRENLNFAKAVAGHLTPLLSAHGFACTESTRHMVKFQSPQVEAVVTHDRLSYEIEIAFARRAEPARRCTLPDMVNAALGPGHKQQTFFQASKAEDVAWCVKIIAELLEKYGHAVLDGERATYQRIEEMARVQNAAYTKQVVQQPVRQKAESAFENHDYTKARELYRSIESDLTPLEKKRLKYAEGHK
jgi:hypothetical protein